MFLDNITTVVLIAPITILICEILGIQARPFLMAEALFSNTGGAATLVGDPAQHPDRICRRFFIQRFPGPLFADRGGRMVCHPFSHAAFVSEGTSQPVKVDILNSVKPREAIKEYRLN